MTGAQPTGSSPPINQYGDVLVHAGNSGFGGEISHQREDELDRAALARARGLISGADPRIPVAYDIGAGYGTMAMKFATVGCLTVACDIAPMPSLRAFAAKTGAVALDNIIERDATKVDWSAFPQPDIVYSQRFLHYLRFSDAVDLMRSILSAAGECDIYLSMSGLHSELGAGYPDAPLQERFAFLSEEMSGKHGIAQEVCLYEPTDAAELAELCDLTTVRIWSSDFGNIKMTARQT